MKAIILARVSTDEQKEAGNSLPSQLARLEKYSLDKNFDIVKRVQFDESAWKDKRKEFNQILNDIKSSKEKMALCCDKIDRLLRNFTKELIILEELRKAGKLELHFPSDNITLHKESPASDLFRFTIGVSLAKYYSDSISDNVKRAYEKMVQNGRITSKAPIGYLNAVDKNGEKTVIMDPCRADFVVKIFELYATGNFSMENIAQIMNSEGMTSNNKTKGKITTRHIEFILKNPFYHGYMRYRGKLYPHKYPVLIHYYLWLECEKIRSQYKTTPSKTTKKPFIFRGLIKCARCGCRITCEIHKNRYVYYHCTNHKGNCQKIYLNQDELLKQVKHIFDKLVLPQNMIDEVLETLKSTDQARNEVREREIKRLKNELSRLCKRQKSLFEEKWDGKVTEELFDLMNKEYNERTYNLKFRLSQLLEAEKDFYITADLLLSLCKRASEIFDSSTIDEKRQLLKIIFSNLKLDGKKLEYKLKKPFEGVFLAGSHQNVGPLCDMFRTIPNLSSFLPSKHHPVILRKFALDKSPISAN